MTAPPFRAADLAPLLDTLLSAAGREVQRHDSGATPSPPAEDDAYVRRWRPTFGYAVALSWLVTMLAVAWVVVHDPAQAPAVIAALLDTTPIWGGALAVLGLSVVKRSQDKRARPSPAAPPADTGAPPAG